MTADTSLATLHAKRAATPLTATDAAAWFAPGTPAGPEIVGYTLSARAATWVRIRSDGSAEHLCGASDVLADAYEMVLFDGERELRWLRTPDGRGPAIALGEDPAALPPGDDVTADPPPRRGATHTRLLAGKPRAHPTPGWTSLGSQRYAAAHLPWAFTGGDVLLIETVEYLVEDEHGNLDVAATRTVGLHATTRAAVRVPATTGPEGTAS